MTSRGYLSRSSVNGLNGVGSPIFSSFSSSLGPVGEEEGSSVNKFSTLAATTSDELFQRTPSRADAPSGLKLGRKHSIGLPPQRPPSINTLNRTITPEKCELLRRASQNNLLKESSRPPSGASSGFRDNRPEISTFSRPQQKKLSFSPEVWRKIEQYALDHPKLGQRDLANQIIEAFEPGTVSFSEVMNHVAMARTQSRALSTAPQERPSRPPSVASTSSILSSRPVRPRFDGVPKEKWRYIESIIPNYPMLNVKEMMRTLGVEKTIDPVEMMELIYNKHALPAVLRGQKTAEEAIQFWGITKPDGVESTQTVEKIERMVKTIKRLEARRLRFDKVVLPKVQEGSLTAEDAIKKFGITNPVFIEELEKADQQLNFPDEALLDFQSEELTPTPDVLVQELLDLTIRKKIFAQTTQNYQLCA